MKLVSNKEPTDIWDEELIADVNIENITAEDALMYEEEDEE